MATKVKPTRLQVTGTPQAGDVPMYVDADNFQRGAGGGGGTGDVSGPASSTDGDVVLFDGATGKLIKDSGVNLSSKLDASALSNNNYGGAWSGDTTHTPTKNALYDKIHTMDVEIGNKAADNTVVKLTGNQTINGTKTFGTSPVVPSKSTAATNTGTAIATEAQVKLVADDVATINGMISSNASSSNKLMDKNYIDDSINSVTAYYITKNAQGDQWATRAELLAATTFYSGGVQRTPTKNDYTIVLADENHDNATTRYIYNSGWEYQYTVNETALTQAQLDALNSGITAAKVTTYDGYASTISGKQDTLVSGTNIKTINSNSLLGSGDLSLNEVPSGGTEGQVLTQTNNGPAWQNATGGAEIEYKTQAEYDALPSSKLTDGKHYVIYTSDGPAPATRYTITGSTIVGSYIPGQFTDLQGFYISPDGLNAYATFWNNGSGKMVQYSLSTSWDISTATQIQNISVTKPNGFDFSDDGNYIFLSTEDGNKIIRYTLSTPRDLSTATLDTGQSISAGASFASKVNISSDGHYIFYPTTATNRPLHRYELTTAFDLSTATNHTYINTSNLCSTVSKDGKFIYKALDIGSEVTQYSLATPYDITSAQTEVGRYNVSYSEGRCLYVSEDGKYWTIGNTSSGITQFEAQPIS